MIAFHGNPKIKETYLNRVRQHRAMDQLIKGTYWENGKGCAVGCTVHSDDHAAYEIELGIPRILARLEDGIFENLPNGKAMEWPERFLGAVPVGADLSMVWPQFAIWLLVDPEHGVIKYARTEASKKAIKDIADAYQLVIECKSQSVDWAKLRADADADAYAAAAYAAAADAAAYAAYAAYADADADAYAAYAAAAAAYAAAYAAYAAADAYAAYAAASRAKIRSQVRIAQSDKLIELLSSAPIPVTDDAMTQRSL